jgi:hypothetical protein
MKKILFFAGLILASLSSFAQSSAFGNTQSSTFGIRSGINFAQLHTSFNNSGASVSTGSLATFSAGVFADFKISSAVSIQPGLNYTGKGASETESSTHFKAKLFYLQLPVNVVYHVEIDPGEIYFGAGPYFAYGLSAKVEVADSTGTQSQNVGFGSGVGKYKSIDAGANIIVGIKLRNGLLLNFNYDLGLTNVSNISGTNTTNRVFGISAGYSFKEINLF